jgi:2-polyprenyl-6-methoxyphenol hydroxylase-like FAD-dependent oxidoreductase
MEKTPILIVGGGPVGMTIANDLADRGIRSILVERNPTTTSHPKMDITNGRSMELFRRAGLVNALRAVAVAESHPFDVSWITSLSGFELHRFKYSSVIEHRKHIRQVNNGTQPREPGMRVSQVDIEPVLKRAIDANPNVDVRFGVEFESLEGSDDGVIATVHDKVADRIYQISCSYLVGCDGGGSRVRENIEIPLSGEARIMPRFMTHFRSDARKLLQRWGIAWHYQSIHGTLIAQNDKDIWTLHSRFPAGQSPETVDPSALLSRFVGATFDHQILVANHWSPHLLVADRYVRSRVLLAGDAAHQYIPTGGYGMNTGIGDAFDVSWKLAAILKGFGGPGLIGSYEQERRPVGLRNRQASAGHNEVRGKIAALYGDHLNDLNEAGDIARRAAAEKICELGNAENESRGIEFGYVYTDSSITAGETVEISDSLIDYHPTTAPGARLPSTFLADGSAIHDLLGTWFTVLAFGDADPTGLVEAAGAVGLPLKVVRVTDPELFPIYQAGLILVRPDQHVAWRGDRVTSPAEAFKLVRKCLGW